MGRDAVRCLTTSLLFLLVAVAPRAQTSIDLPLPAVLSRAATYVDTYADHLTGMVVEESNDRLSKLFLQPSKSTAQQAAKTSDLSVDDFTLSAVIQVAYGARAGFDVPVPVEMHEHYLNRLIEAPPKVVNLMEALRKSLSTISASKKKPVPLEGTGTTDPPSAGAPSDSRRFA